MERDHDAPDRHRRSRLIIDHCCDTRAHGVAPGGVSRRAFLGGTLGSLLGLMMAPSLLPGGGRSAWAALAGAGGAQGSAAALPPARSIITLWLAGGPSHIDTFDPKPGALTGGPFKAIPTRIPEVRLCEHLPQIAEVSDRLAFIRSMTSSEGNHQRARYYLQTGYKPGGTVRHPALGSLVWERLGESGETLPSFISIRGASVGPGFLGTAYAPFEVRRPGQPVDNLGLARGVDGRRFDDRLKMLETVEQGFVQKRDQSQVHGLRSVRESAVKLMRSAKVEAFDLDDEPALLKTAYGDNDFGRGCLLARRLVEAGARCVEVTLGGWDTHQDNFTRCQELLGQFDPAFATLVKDLEDRKLLDSTLIVAMGEFGRTPRINPNEGRDHYPRAFSAVVAGGGLRCGVAVGATDPTGEKVISEPVTVPDLIATLTGRLGMDRDFEHQTPVGRPIKIVDGGTPIAKIMPAG